MLKRLKTITSHTGHARWLAETSDDPTGYLARVQVEEIPSPYCYSASVAIHEWNGRQVVCFETRHKRYEVFEVPAELLRFKTDDEATDWHVRFRPGRDRIGAA
jgi:hypothetical protein